MRWLAGLVCLVVLPAFAGGSQEFDSDGSAATNDSARVEFDSQPTKDTTHTFALWWYALREDESAGSRLKQLIGYGDEFDIRASDSNTPGDTQNRYICSANGGSNTLLITYASAAVNQWYFFGCSADGTNLTTYLGDPSAANRNLTQAGQTAFSGNITDVNPGAYGGYAQSMTSNADFYPDGVIAYVQEWDRGLTQEELQTAMWTPGCVSRGLIRYHPATDNATNDNDPTHEGGSEQRGGTVNITTASGTPNVNEYWNGPPIKGRCR